MSVGAISAITRCNTPMAALIPGTIKLRGISSGRASATEIDWPSNVHLRVDGATDGPCLIVGTYLTHILGLSLHKPTLEAVQIFPQDAS